MLNKQSINKPIIFSLSRSIQIIRLFDKALLFFSFMSLSLFSCTPEEEVLSRDPQAKLSFSEDAIIFDTVFAGIPTPTEILTVYNPNKNAITIERVDLGGGINSPYQVWINGIPIPEAKNIRITGGDSLKILAKASIDMRNEKLPFVVYDSLTFHTHTNQQNIKLLAWGQDVNFIKGNSLFPDGITEQVWTAGKPYIVYDSVKIPPSCKLIIEEGTKVFGYTSSFLTVEGSLVVQGTPDKPVLFSNFRQEKYYQQPGQWGGIIIKPGSTNNIIQGAEIRNAIHGIAMQANTGTSRPTLKVENTIIKNIAESGITAFNADVTVINTLITDCIKALFIGMGGGSYNFNHCTLVHFNSNQTVPGLLFSNTYKTSEKDIISPLSLDIQNSIIWGNLPDEIEIVRNPDAEFTSTVQYSFIKTKKSDSFSGNNNQLNIDPKFAASQRGEFKPDSLSPLINAGIPTTIVKDILGKPRDTQPDIGAYER